MTSSIIAVDHVTGQIGAAVQSCMPSVGAAVPCLQPGLGAVASQAFADPAYGPRCLDGLASGLTSSDALGAAQQADPTPVLRQVAVIDAAGIAAVATGDLCVDHAGHVVGDGFAAQANMASSPEVWPAMAAAFQSSSGPFAWRLLESLRAGEAAGGDARGRMSAALIVVEGHQQVQPGWGTVIDLRVDRDDDPLTRLGELLTATEVYGTFNMFVEQFFAGDAAAALNTITRALQVLPDEGNFRFGRVGALLGTGNADAALIELHELISARPSWAELFRGFVGKGLMTLPNGLSLEAALSARPEAALPSRA